MSSSNKKLSEVLFELKMEYLGKFPARVQSLKELTETGDWQALEEAYHRLKGTGKTYGFPEVSVVCERLEFLAQDPSTQDLDLFREAVDLLERMSLAFQRDERFDLSEDPTNQRILSLKPRR